MSRKLIIRMSLVAICGLFLATAVVEAQQGQRGEGQRGQGQRGQGRRGFGGGGFGFGGRGGPRIDLMGLTRIPKVQEELEMLEDQVAAVQKLAEQQRGGGGRGRGGRPGGDGEREGRGDRETRGRRDGSDEDRQARFAEFMRRREELAKQNKEKLAEILLPHQLDRLNQIRIQVLGTGALEDSEVAAKLKITEEQKKGLKAERDAMASQFRELFTGGGDREGMFEKMRELRTESEKKLMAVLSDEQQKQLEELKGEPFEMPRGAFRGFGGRGRGGPGGGRPGRPERPQRPERPPDRKLSS